ncbi:helix-turn-helix domain-containing protein [Agrilactobacillus fermenti]|uniref:helix-turn-helix domain-containing protein n=1 Tax=Agrilactobacillus fermenti TaxID=2586909 RepID=UPI003A5C37E0
MSVLSRIKDLVNQKGITIAELERKLDFGQGSIRKWDKQSPSSERLQKVADYFDVSTDYLLGRKSPDNQDDRINVDDIIENNRRLFYKSSELSEQDQEFINKFLRTYLESKEGQDRLRKNGYKEK